jgi:hypothetical protein
MRAMGGRPGTFAARRPRLRAAALLAAGLAVGGCAAQQQLVREADERQDNISRGIAGVVDRVDRAFGEPRIEDRDRIVRAKIGGSLEVRQNNADSWTIPISLRLPLPALERRSNIFLQFESTADASGDFEEVKSSFDEGKAVSATILTRRSPRLETGARLELFWDDGPQTGVRPFLRVEQRLDPIRLSYEQQVYYLTDVQTGARGIFEADRLLEEQSFVRFTTSMDGNHGTPGVSLEHSLGYLRPLPFVKAAFAAEVGVKYNTFDGDPETHDSGSENDPDEGYARLRATGRVLRPWIEYEVIPVVHFPWHHEDKVEPGITFILRAVFQRNLPGPPEPSGAALPDVPEGSAVPADR